MKTAPPKLSKNLTNVLTSLLIKHPWLQTRHQEALDLIDFCETLEEQELLLNLLSKFCFLDPSRYQIAINSICKKVVSEWKLEEDKTMLVAFSADEEADSGQAVVYDLRSAIAQLGWRRTKTVNRFGLAQRHIETRPYVILVDEFMGTGRTLVGRSNNPPAKPGAFMV